MNDYLMMYLLYAELVPIVNNCYHYISEIRVTIYYLKLSHRQIYFKKFKIKRNRAICYGTPSRVTPTFTIVISKQNSASTVLEG